MTATLEHSQATPGASINEPESTKTLQMMPPDILREVLRQCAGPELAAVSIASSDLRQACPNASTLSTKPRHLISHGGNGLV